MDTVVKDALSRVSIRDRKHSADDDDKQHESGFEDSYHHEENNKLTDEEGKVSVQMSVKLVWGIEAIEEIEFRVFVLKSVKLVLIIIEVF